MVTYVIKLQHWSYSYYHFCLQGGYSTKQEMCLAFVLYYPRIQLAACYSMTPVKYFFETFGVRQFYDVDMDTVEKMFLSLLLPDNKWVLPM